MDFLLPILPDLPRLRKRSLLDGAACKTGTGMLYWTQPGDLCGERGIRDMESSFRTAVFGGFNRQDVTEYISRTAREHSERLEQIEKENTDLRAQLERMRELEGELEALRRDYENAAQELAEEKAAREQDRRQLEESAARTEKLEQLRQEAEEYSDVKEHIAGIELEARRRADDLLDAARAQSNAMLEEAGKRIRELQSAASGELGELYEQYQRLTDSLQTAADHVSGELRRMDVAVGQLPLAFDKVRTKLEKLGEQAAVQQ